MNKAEDFKEWAISLRGGFLSFRFLPAWLAFGHNNAYPLLKTSADFFEIRVVFRKKKFFYHELLGLDVSTGFLLKNAVTFYPKKGLFSYTINLDNEKDIGKVLQFFEHKGVLLLGSARKFLAG